MQPLTLVETPGLFEPNAGGQQQFMDDYTHRFLALAGGWYAGKTWAGARKLLDLHIFNAFNDKGKRTGVDSCVIAQTYQLAETTNIPELKRAMDEAAIRYRFVADQKKYWFELPQLNAAGDPSLIIIRTADAPGRITAFTVGAIWGDEVARWKTNDDDPTGDPLLQAIGRLRDTKARFLQFLMTFTHEGDATKVYEDFERTPKPDHKLYRAGLFENPHAKAYGESLKLQLTPNLAAQYIDGMAASFRGGSVYDNFDEVVNLDPNLELDHSRPLQLAIDFNVSPGLHAEIGQYFPDRQLATTTHEIYEDRASVKRLVGMLREMLPKIGAFVGGVWKFPGQLELFGDASGGNENLATGESCWNVLADGLRTLGIPFTMVHVPASNPHIADRVNAVNCAFKSMDGRVRYKAHPTRCPKLVKDWKSLKWAGNEVDKKDRKLSHPSEADGYRIWQLIPITRRQASTGRVLTTAPYAR